MIANRPAAGSSPTPASFLPADPAEPEFGVDDAFDEPVGSLFDVDGDAPHSDRPLTIVIPPAGPANDTFDVRARLAELVGWQDLLGAPGDTTPLLRRPRVLVLLGAVVFALSPFVVAAVDASRQSTPTLGPARTLTSTERPTANSSSTVPLPILTPSEASRREAFVEGSDAPAESVSGS